MLWFGPGVAARDLGRRRSFADMGQTIPAISVLLLWRTGKAASRRDTHRISQRKDAAGFG
jgi:hypothetical protein